MTHRTRHGAEGFSLLEALLSAALVLIITLGILPLFAHSVVQNVSGRESTISTNHSRSSSEELVPLPLDRDRLRPDAGQNTKEICQEYEHEVGWAYYDCSIGVDNTDAAHQKLWARSSSVQQYSINEIYDADTKNGVPTFNNPTTGYPVPDERFDSFVHIREIMITTESQREQGSVLGAGRRVDLINLRGF